MQCNEITKKLLNYCKGAITVIALILWYLLMKIDPGGISPNISNKICKMSITALAWLSNMAIQFAYKVVWGSSNLVVDSWLFTIWALTNSKFRSWSNGGIWSFFPPTISRCRKSWGFGTTTQSDSSSVNCHSIFREDKGFSGFVFDIEVNCGVSSSC